MSQKIFTSANIAPRVTQCWIFRNLMRKSASCATYAIAELALRLIAVFLVLAQLAVRFEINICFLHYIMCVAHKEFVFYFIAKLWTKKIRLALI